MKIPENMLLGVATAATQIEGGDKNNSWYKWSINGGTKDGSTPFRANDHFNRYKEDIALMAKMKIQIYRFGLEWSRIEGEKGVFNLEAIEFYRNILKELKKYNIKPLVTLYHFSVPLWFEELGAFEKAENVEYFTEYVKFVVEQLGSEVNEWITINEPNVYAVNGYFFGIWPPGKKSFTLIQRVYANLVRSHIKSYKIIHEIRKSMGFDDTRVSFANHLRIFQPMKKWNPIHCISAYFMDKCFQKSLTHAFSTGKASFPIPSALLSDVEFGKYYDFIAINYYSRDAVTNFKNEVFPNVKTSDLGWEIYPEGIGILAKRMYELYKAPIFITENGTCDKNDSFRQKFIYDHLKVLIESGLPIERYYYWTFMDNFEWAEGETAPFGLVALDFESQERKIRSSGNYYTKLIETRNLTES